MKLHEMDERMRRLERSAASGDPDAIERLEQARFQGGGCSHVPGIRDVKVEEDWTYASHSEDFPDYVDYTTFTATCKRCGEELERESIWEDPEDAKPPTWTAEDPKFRPGTLTRAYDEYQVDQQRRRDVKSGLRDEEEDESYVGRDEDDYDYYEHEE